MKIITLRTDYPVPSCEISKLVRENGKWFYEYDVKNKGNHDIGEGPLYIYGHIQQLTLISSIKSGHLNIEINSIEDLYELLRKQEEADQKFRKDFISKNPDYYEKVAKVTIKNETQKPQIQNVISVFEEKDDETTFIVVPN